MIVRRSALTLAVQLLQLAATIAVTILVTRETGASGKGMYTLVALTVSISTLVCGLGISWASIYYIGRGGYAVEDAAGAVTTTSLVSATVATGVVAAVFALFRSTYFHELNGTQIAIALIVTPVSQLSTGLGSILLGLNRVAQYAAVNLAQVLVTLALQSGIAIAVGLTATSALGCWAFGTGAALVIVAFLVGSRTSFWPRVNFEILRSYLSYGIKGYIANVMTLLNYRLDSLIVNGLIGVAQLGIYSIAVAMAELLWYAANSISLVMFPHVSGLSREEANRVTPIVTRNTLFLTFIGAAGMFVLGRWVILFVLGPAMLPAVTPLWLLLPGIVTLSAGKVIASYLSGIGKPIWATYISGTNVVLTIALDLLLIPRYGIAGAAVASSIVYTSATVLSVIVFLKESGRSWRETLIVQREDFRRYIFLLNSFRRRFRRVGAAET